MVDELIERADVGVQPLLAVLTRFVRALHGDEPTAAALVDLCQDVSAVIGAEGAGVMIADDGGALRVVAASDERFRRIEAAQIEAGEGPCIHAYSTASPVVADDAEVAARFPAFAQHLGVVPFRMVHAVPLHADGHTFGSLNYFWAAPAALGVEQREVATLMADLAAAYLMIVHDLEVSSSMVTNLQRALSSRAVIEQAKGGLAMLEGITPAGAFDAIRRYARAHRRPVAEVAEDLIEGRLPVGDVLG
ncbi:GAF and ANTAR domain-containing protein [Euzebya sp.]|uniref:GAF and ANTAR domain-containing protein n=1 Tax=Euzebya sp. TaxID=1971409 RepID=UPI0035152A26